MCISRATVSAVSCLVVPAFICIDLLISRVLKLNDDDDDDDKLHAYIRGLLSFAWQGCKTAHPKNLKCTKILRDLQNGYFQTGVRTAGATEALAGEAHSAYPRTGGKGQ